MNIIDGLPRYFLGDDGQMHQTTPARSARYAPVGPWLTGASVVNALANPTDEQVDKAARKVAANMQLWPEQCVDAEWAKLPPVEREDWRALVRESWAAAAGDDQ